MKACRKLRNDQKVCPNLRKYEKKSHKIRKYLKVCQKMRKCAKAMKVHAFARFPTLSHRSCLTFSTKFLHAVHSFCMQYIVVAHITSIFEVQYKYFWHAVQIYAAIFRGRVTVFPRVTISQYNIVLSKREFLDVRHRLKILL